MKAALYFSTLVLIFFTFISCQKDKEELPLLMPDPIAQLVLDFQGQTGIKIFYEQGNSELQKQIEVDHSIQVNDYTNVTSSELQAQIQRVINIINDFPEAFIQEVDLDAILIIDSDQPNWVGHATTSVYRSIAFDGA